jgi:transcriptional regulator with XRE-family HTH domain
MKTTREQLAVELRRLRELSGRSLKDLETDTLASDSSLSRYLSGKTMPPWTVVAGLCRAAGREPEALRPLWAAAGNDQDQATKPATPGAASEGGEAGEPGEPGAAETTIPAAPTAGTQATAPSARRRGVRWPQAMVFLVIGAVLGIGAPQLPKIVSRSGHPAGTNGPHFSVTLLEPARPQGTTAIWSFNARCGNADEYRLVYDLPISVQHRATAYRVDHADCTVKLFDGIGGSGIGEPLANDQRLHLVPPALARRGSSIVAYSCCNGTILNPGYSSGFSV